MDQWIVEENFDGDDAEPLEDDEMDEELDDELDGEDEDGLGGVDGDLDGDDEGGEDDEQEDDVPTARRKRPSDVDDDEDEDIDPDDVEADLDAILKDRIAASSDDDEDDDEVAEAGGTDGDGTERVAAKSAEEFTCTTCFMIVHPRQFGRRDNLTCPEGYSPCSSIEIVEARLKKPAKK